MRLTGASKMKALCVYCSSSDRLDTGYYQVAEQLGRTLVAHHWSLVYGGGNTGLMGSLARSVRSHGGHIVGVIPEFMKRKELAFADADEMISVDTMRERKLVMETRADAFLALPGGWGTLEEILEILTLRQLDVLRKPCVLLNQEGFYDELLKLFDRMMEEHFTKPSSRELFYVAHTVEQVFDLIENSPVIAELKWFETKI
jgi:cytokinin riboside 5'-monophosphate phosphoribohydrolase